ncbi:glycosyltransferase [Aliiroseovarius sp. xm-v-204]|uniref:glycosyltransferase n=1 Tax=Aliiroseovarius sp. xm-v-204 TaxID=2651834 RepID=UPI0015688E5E|nr:glycosyltransferase [Aliiroseovarius sp. xm-v-204]NRQ22322.1 putative teichuronic acid biosynthesis glycosyltransferase TuaH [Aliiroseovarius sp. xm-v-204]
MAPASRQILFVLGMHRSGTSFLTEALGQMGFAIPNDRSAPAPDNLHGHFEPLALVGFNDRLLRETGTDWRRLNQPEDIILDDYGSADLGDALDKSFGDSSRIVIKDPRLSLTLPSWRGLLGDFDISMQALIALRDPWAVAASLAKRDGLPTSYSLAMWLAHILSALEVSRGLPRALVVFPDWTQSVEDTLKTVSDLIGVPSPAPSTILELYEPDAVHAAATRTDDVPRGLADLADEVFADLRALAQKHAMPTMKQVSDWFKRYMREAAPAIAAQDQGQRLLKTADAQYFSLKKEHTVLEDQLNTATRDYAVLAGNLQLVEEQRDAAETRAQEIAAGVEHLQEQLQATEEQRDAAETRAQEIAAGVEHLQEQLQATEEQRDAAETRAQEIAAGVEHLQEQLQATEEQRDAAETRAQEIAAGVEHLQEQLQATEEQRDAAETRAQEIAAGVEHLQEQLQATEEQRDVAMSHIEEMRKTVLQLQDQLTDAESRVQSGAADMAQAEQLLALAEQQRDAVEARAQDIAAGAARMQAQLHATEWQRDEVQERLDIVQAQAEQWRNDASAQVDYLLSRLEVERMTVLKPIYRRIYGFGGRQLRRFLPGGFVEHLKRRLPVPGGVPAALAFTPMEQTGVTTELPEIAPAQPGKPDIFVLSIINWDFRTQRPQHLANEMAAQGHRVFFIEMDRAPVATEVRTVASGVHVVRLSNRRIRALANYSGVPSAFQARAWIDHFYALADAVNTQGLAHIVVEHPYWWNFAKHLSPQFQITFDCMDEIAGFSNTEQHILDAEAELIAKADKMIVSSQYLYDKYSAQRDVVLVRNGTDVSHFVNVPEPAPLPAFLQGKLAEGKIHVGYVGAIAEWFDTDMLEAVARDNPDFDIHLCGAVTAEAPMRLADVPNITLHGEIPYSEVPLFHKAMDVLIIPFQLLPIIKACDPVKFYEYSAVMRPTVSTSLPELERAGDLVFTADTPGDFAKAIRDAAQNDQSEAFGTQLRDYALDNNWAFRARDILAEMTHEPRLSVVVLSYGDPGLTLATLHGLVGQGVVYPNLEIIVSDNGSDEAALTALREVAARHSEIRLIENGENLGFAKGNNVGIAAATGEYVLLLNNDTFVAPHSLIALVRHMQRNPELGIVGPMTNNIGNEARIEVNYTDMDDMAVVTRALATGYRGHWTPMPVAAYFCAIMRKADIDRLGDVPEIYGRGMFEDDDHCATFRADGFEIGLAEDSFVHHHLSASFDALPSAEKQALFEHNKAVFEERWGPWVPHRYRTDRPEGSLE